MLAYTEAIRRLFSAFLIEQAELHVAGRADQGFRGLF